MTRQPAAARLTLAALPRAWLQAALSAADHLPLVGHWRIGARRGLVLGLVTGGLALFLAGATLGGLNRGPSGMLIGGLSGAVGGVVVGALAGALVGPLYYYDSDACTLEIRLDGSEGPFAPGDLVRGHLLLTANRSIQVEEGGVRFRCRGLRTYDQVDAESNGTPRLVRETLEYCTEEARIIPQRAVRRGQSLRYPFEFTISEEGMPTHHGNVCAVRWGLQADVTAQRVPPIRAYQEVLVVAPAPEVRRVSGEYRAIGTCDACHLLLSLPRAVFSPGDEVGATLRVTPKRSFSAEEIRAVLLRVEWVPAGDDHIVYIAEFSPSEGLFRGERRDGGRGTTYIWLEAEAELAGPTSVRLGEPLTFAFSLPLPRFWLPSMRTADGSVTWKLGTVLRRAGKPDVRAFHEVVVHTWEALPAHGQDVLPSGGGVRVRRVDASAG